MTVLLEAQHLRKAFAGNTVIDGVSLSLKQGQVVMLIGPNGSGKTTLLKLLLGLETPDSGAVIRKPNLRIGYLPQKMLPDPVIPVTVEWFLRLYAKGKPIEPIAEEVGVTEHLKARLQSLSGGELQRVLLARALLCEPELLVLDEPVQGVDINGQAQLYRLINHIRDRHHLSVLMVSHDLHLVMSATDEVICLNHHVCCVGHPHEVKSDPAFVALFGQHVADSLAVYTHHHDHQHH